MRRARLSLRYPKLILLIISLPLRGLLLLFNVFSSRSSVIRDLAPFYNLRNKNVLYVMPPPTTAPIEDMAIMKTMIITDIMGNRLFGKILNRVSLGGEGLPLVYNNYTIMLTLSLIFVLVLLLRFPSVTNKWTLDFVYYYSNFAIPILVAINIDCIRMIARIATRDKVGVLRMPLGFLFFCIGCFYYIMHTIDIISEMIIFNSEIKIENALNGNLAILISLVILMGSLMIYFKNFLHSTRKWS